MSLVIKSLVKSFTSNSVVSIANLELPATGRIALRGASGVGKTTLLRLIAGLEKPDFGSIYWQEHIFVSESKWIPPWKRSVGMVFQDLALWPHLTANEHIDLALQQVTGEKRKQRKANVQNHLKRYHLDNLGHRFPNELSGGQQQRLALARAMAAKPDILLFDEPFTGLDTLLKDALWSEIEQQTDHSLMIFVSHHKEDLMRGFDQCYEMTLTDIVRVNIE